MLPPPTMAIEDTPEAPPSVSKEVIDTVSSSSPDGNSSSGGSDSGTSTTFRTQIGSHLSLLTDVVNDNLIIIRSATFATVFLLGAYGVANTPLFYRYKHLNDIASKVFTKRKRIHGRIIGVVDNSTNNKVVAGYASDMAATSSPAQQTPITILFRHSSPIERLLSQSAMEKILQFTTARGKSTSGLLYSPLNTNRNLLPIELAGICLPPTIASTNNHHSASVLSPTLTTGSSTSSSYSTSSQVPEVLQSLIEKNARVSLQMLALRTDSPSYKNGTERAASSLPMDESGMHSAICHLNYRKPNQWFSTTNLGLELVQRGQALVNQDGLVIPTKDDDNNNAALIDFNPTVKQLQADSTFISQLEEAEFEAWKSREGVWSSSQMRELRKEYVEEEEFLNSSLWSRIKRGLSWIVGTSRK